jgi:hypothetical protein
MRPFKGLTELYAFPLGESYRRVLRVASNGGLAGFLRAAWSAGRQISRGLWMDGRRPRCVAVLFLHANDAGGREIRLIFSTREIPYQ